MYKSLLSGQYIINYDAREGHEIGHCMVAKLLQKDFKQLHIYHQINWFLGGNCISFQGVQRCDDNKWLVIVQCHPVNNFAHFFDKIWKFWKMKSKINLKYDLSSYYIRNSSLPTF